MPSQNKVTPEKRAKLLPLLKSLEKVMENQVSSPEDIGELLTLSRDLSNEVPQGNTIPGLSNLATSGLTQSGPVVVQVRGRPHVLTQYGKCFFLN